jgi:hypothetical protein
MGERVSERGKEKVRREGKKMSTQEKEIEGRREEQESMLPLPHV